MRTLAAPDQTERAAAAAVHIGAMFAPIWVPLGAFLLTHRSRKFIAEHARQSLTETILLNVCIGVAMVASLTYTALSIWSFYQQGLDRVDWGSVVWQSLLRMGAWWLLMGILWVVNFVVSLRQASQALRGEWPKATLRRQAKLAR
jgi:hypothetical protein